MIRSEGSQRSGAILRAKITITTVLRLVKDSPRPALHLSAARPGLAHLIVRRARRTSRCEGGRPRSPEGKKASVNGGGEELKLMKSRGTRRLAVFVPVPEDAPVGSSSSNLLRDVVLGYNTCRSGPEVTLQPYFILRHSWCDPRLWSQSFLLSDSEPARSVQSALPPDAGRTRPSSSGRVL